MITPLCTCSHIVISFKQAKGNSPDPERLNSILIRCAARKCFWSAGYRHWKISERCLGELPLSLWDGWTSIRAVVMETQSTECKRLFQNRLVAKDQHVVYCGRLTPLLGLPAIEAMGLVYRADEVTMTQSESGFEAAYPAVDGFCYLREKKYMSNCTGWKTSESSD